jgi:glycosyltransferase involved in cell wall biosynthesis
MDNSKVLILGSVAGPCPPKKAGGTERVAYVQAKELAKKGIPLLFVGGVGTKQNFTEQLAIEKEEKPDAILQLIEFVEIGGNTQMGNASDSIRLDPSTIEASRKLRMEMVALSQVQTLMIERKEEYSVILNNMRGEAVLLPLAKELGKTIICVMHLSLFPELAETFQKYQTRVITISDSQQNGFEGVSFLRTIYNPVHTASFVFNDTPQEYALMLSTIGYHKNQKDAIRASKKAGIRLILGGKIRDAEYFESEIKPHLKEGEVEYIGEVGFEEKMKLYRDAKVFLFPITWQEPFGLVLIEALSCGTPVIAYPHGGPQEIIHDEKTGFLVSSAEEMAEKIRQVGQIKREDCRSDVEKRFDDQVIGEQYAQVLTPLI